MSATAVTAAPEPSAREIRLVIAASSAGTVFEWYDFYLYGLLATIITAQFFSGVNETTGFIFALAAFAAGVNVVCEKPPALSLAELDEMQAAADAAGLAFATVFQQRTGTAADHVRGLLGL